MNKYQVSLDELDYEELKESLLLLSSRRFKEFIEYEIIEPSHDLRLNALIDLIHIASRDLNKRILDLEHLIG